MTAFMIDATLVPECVTGPYRDRWMSYTNWGTVRFLSPVPVEDHNRAAIEELAVELFEWMKTAPARSGLRIPETAMIVEIKPFRKFWRQGCQVSALWACPEVVAQEPPQGVFVGDKTKLVDRTRGQRAG